MKRSNPTPISVRSAVDWVADELIGLNHLHQSRSPDNCGRAQQLSAPPAATRCQKKGRSSALRARTAERKAATFGRKPQCYRAAFENREQILPVCTTSFRLKDEARLRNAAGKFGKICADR